MSNPNPTGNGCSLEDCYTNLFALTDLCGIKWKRLQPKQDHVCCVDPLDDPVLQSFTKCIRSDILCVWRRVLKSGSDQRSAAGSENLLTCNKELWIFWYGNEPDNLANLISGLDEAENGNWENGLTYECRTLLYKAIHNLIEKCLMGQGFVRIGKWFVQPFECGVIPKDKSTHLSISFSFFLHGESQVCASIDVRQHPPLYRLQQHHLALAAQSSPGLQVVLGPYGLAGTLTGQQYKESDIQTQKLLEEWRQFYILRDGPCDVSGLPPAVEVIVAGVRMRYPTCFVLVSPDEDHDRPIAGAPPGSAAAMVPPPPPPPPPRPVNIGALGALTPPTSPCDGAMMREHGMAKMGMPQQNDREAGRGPSYSAEHLLGHRIIEKIWQDSCISCSGSHRHQTSDGDEAAYLGTWDFTDPTTRHNCHCPKGNPKKQRQGLLGVNKQNFPVSSALKTIKTEKGEKLEKMEKPHVKPGKGLMLFHRRMQLAEEMLHVDVDFVLQRAPYVPNNPPPAQSQFNSFNAVKPAPPSDVVSPLQSTHFGNSSSVNGVESPHSRAPSPLVATPIQPSAGSQNGDPTMPTLSPHPPPKTGDRDTRSSQSSQGDPVLPDDPGGITAAYPNPKMMDNCIPQATHDSVSQSFQSSSISQQPQQQATAQQQQLSQAPQQQQQQAQANVNGFVDPAQNAPNRTSQQGIKRPTLATDSFEEEAEDVGGSLYDYSHMDSWLQMPVKRARSDRLSEEGSARIGHSFGSSINHYLSGGGGSSERTPSPQPSRDPYEFSDESSIGAGTFQCAGIRSIRTSIDERSPFYRQEGDTRKSIDKDEKDVGMGSPPPGGRPATALMRPEDLVAKLTDLENIFESDEDSNDHDPFTEPVGTAPTNEESKKNSKSVGNSDTCSTGLTSMELIRMYPTPPSLETHNPALSPGMATDTLTEPIIDHCSSQMDTADTAMMEESQKDWSFVFKLPTVAYTLSSNKYAPIDVPSTKLPPLNVNSDFIYKPWQFTIPIMEKPVNSHYPSLPSNEAVVNSQRVPADRMTSVEASPAPFISSSQQRTPGSYELPSPASNASSYLNKTLDSVNNSSTNSQAPEAHSLVVNVLLSDSILNLYKDSNFNSCSICVCNMNIKGADVGLYIPDPTAEPQYKCMCGFSAVMNRKYGTNAGLFYEDEVDITGIRDDRLERHKPSLLVVEPAKDGQSGVSKETTVSVPDVIPQRVLLMLQGQFSSPFPSCLTMQMDQQISKFNQHSDHSKTLEMQDGCEACYSALEQGRQAMDNCSSSKLEDPLAKKTCLHIWPYLQVAARMPPNPQDAAHLLKDLKPVLQDCIHNKQTPSWEVKYNISGPLSWKDFHLLSGRASDESSEPQPIPPLLVGYDKDWLSLSPFALQHWDKLFVEPYCQQRDVAYVIISPEHELILNHVRNFFKELSTTYELCLLGRHSPVSDKLRDGILRVGKHAASKVMDQQVDEWFTLIGNSPIAAKIKLYAQICKNWLAPFLASQQLDKIFAETPPLKPVKPEPSLAYQSHSSDHGAPSTPQNHSDDREDGDGSTPDGSCGDSGGDQEGADLPSVVVYFVDPFTYGQEWNDPSRLATLGIFRCFQGLLESLPEVLQSHVHLQVVPLQHILDNQPGSQSQYFKQLAFSVFTQCRRTMQHSILGRSLTGFGPAAAAERLLKGQDHSKSVVATKLFSPPFVLAPMKDIQAQLSKSHLKRPEISSVLFCSYCLSEDQQWLLGVCTDERGEILETCTINIEIPNRNRRKKASALKIGLQKLWDFLVSVMATCAQPWRLVIGRFGRLGHGELKEWSKLLRRRHLQSTTDQLQKLCSMCQMNGWQQAPCILSACLTSMELNRNIYIMTESIKSEEKQSSNLPLHTPGDCSVTHILVFPTSATAQSNSNIQTQAEDNQMDLQNIEDEIGDASLLQNEEFMTEFGDLGDMFVDMFSMDNSVADPSISVPGSPNGGTSGRHASVSAAAADHGPSGFSTDQGQEGINLLQQPLAMGYYLSTGKTGPLPKWFWTHCAHREKHCPTCFMAALHIHSPGAQLKEEPSHSSNSRHNHPLDSTLTCDVLRYVLETYNALSWLTIDPQTNDRRSCLPAHLVVLMQLYHAMNTYV